MTFSVEAGEPKHFQLTKGVRGRPAVKSVTFIIVTSELSSETQYHTQKHNAAYSIQHAHFSMTVLWEATIW